MEKSSVLFVCDTNAVLSQMAEGFLRWYAGDYYEVRSAGVEPKPIHPMTIQVMEELGIDMQHHTAKNLSAFSGKQDFAYLISVKNNLPDHFTAIPGMGVRLSWRFENPDSLTGTEVEELTAFRQVRDQIELCILDWLSEQGVLAAR